MSGAVRDISDEYGALIVKWYTRGRASLVEDIVIICRAFWAE
jgi:hypothetical protein